MMKIFLLVTLTVLLTVSEGSYWKMKERDTAAELNEERKRAAEELDAGERDEEVLVGHRANV